MTSAWIVTLTPEQELRSARVGFARQQNAIERGLTPRHRGGSLWCGHIEGACAELAVSIALDLPWTGEHTFETPPFVVPDVGERTEVRWVAPSSPVLYFDARRDHDDRVYVLASGYAPTFTIHGSILGARCRDGRWLHEYPERVVYRVPLHALHPLTRDAAVAA